MEGLRALVSLKKKERNDSSCISYTRSSKLPKVSSVADRREPTSRSGETQHPHIVERSGELISESSPNQGEHTLAADVKRFLDQVKPLENGSSVLCEKGSQIVLRFLRSINEPCTLFAESPTQRLSRVRSLLRREYHSDEPNQCELPKRSTISVLNAVTDFSDYRDLDEDSKVIMKWIQAVLESWLDRIGYDRDSPGDTESVNSQDVVLFRNTSAALTPLYDILNRGLLDSGVKESLLSIVSLASLGSFSEANAEFLKLAIGNKPWPIGVGNCFIQERASMDRIATSSHLLNDETTRRYIQCIKRLLTKAQEFSSNIAPA